MVMGQFLGGDDDLGACRRVAEQCGGAGVAGEPDP
jgi:hypothetical protein